MSFDRIRKQVESEGYLFSDYAWDRIVELAREALEQPEQYWEGPQQRQQQLPQGDYIILSDLRSSLFASTSAAALVELASDNASLAVGVGVLAELAQRYKRLSGDERTVLEVLAHLAQGGSIYRVWIAEDELLKSLDHDLSADAPKRLLANMQSRGILEEGAGKWRAVW